VIGQKKAAFSLLAFFLPITNYHSICTTTLCFMADCTDVIKSTIGFT